MTILCVGANGMLGHMVMQYFLKQGHNIVGTNRTDFDIAQQDSVLKFFASCVTDVDAIINCAGTLVSRSQDHTAEAVLVNSWFPNFLQDFFKHSKTKIIHISTDCVFDGARGNYIEHDRPTETNAYGRTKALGEIANDKDVTLRTSIIGPEISEHRTGLLDWVINRSGHDIQGWEDSWWNGVTTLQLARVIETVLGTANSKGLYHVASDPISKFELIKTIVDVYGLHKHIERTKGPKPINKVLVDTRKDIDFGIPPHAVQIRQLKNFHHDQ